MVVKPALSTEPLLVVPVPLTTSAKATKNAGSDSVTKLTLYCCAEGLDVVLVNCWELPVPPAVIAILFQLEPPLDEYCICKVKFNGILAVASLVACPTFVLEKPSPPKEVFNLTLIDRLVVDTKVIDCHEAEVSPLALKVLDTVATGVPVVADISVKARSVNPP